MASILFVGSFLAGSLLSLLIPISLLIALVVWQTRAIMRVPRNPAETAAQGAGAAEVEGRTDAGDGAPQSTNP
ncbi:MAG TPA: hypothetical protein VIH85_24845 [Solirubrobacteraceae bacterium]|jgi:hypothetical protein